MLRTLVNRTAVSDPVRVTMPADSRYYIDRRSCVPCTPPSPPQSREESPLSLFHHCDREVSKQLTQLNHVIIEHPDDLGRRSQLMTRLKESQNNLMDVVMVIIQAACPDSRARRDYRMKYPDDILLHQLNGESAPAVLHTSYTVRVLCVV